MDKDLPRISGRSYSNYFTDTYMAEVGRPTLMTEETLNKLDEAFSYGATDKEACFIANISTQTLYNYQLENPEYVERKEGLKDMTKYSARRNVSMAVTNGDKQLSQWYLERKVKKEFAQRSELTGEEGKALTVNFDPTFNKDAPTSEANTNS